MSKKSWHHDKDKRQKWLQFMQDFHPQIDSQTIRLMDELGHVSRAIYQMGEQSVEDAGLSFAQYRVLMHLFFAEEMGERAELNPSEISDRQGVSRNTMSAFIRSLEEEGLVERRLDPHDRRRFNISLTESGRDVVRQHTRQHLGTIDRFFSVLSRDEQINLLNLLRKLSGQAAVSNSV
ncbi:MAG: MarR family transcriptional regulator [Anaerolineales bacterium]|uniref:MarR family winged helix-turn-helix transcriptional regulator n=1 Tax=Promineifilum sp. TaxID=2664178 RepID=UPI001D5FC7E8|nr:MarR family transcriptional regulator [Anaerolineales bacterium]MCO5179311.1 MarR family transcriptional regulator [Promineifilum sp.]